MPPQTRLDDKDTGHDACPPRPLNSGSPNVIVNGKLAGRVGDTYTPHSCSAHAPHIGVIDRGSATVIINGKQAGRIGDPVSCGGNVAEGSPDVIVGG